MPSIQELRSLLLNKDIERFFEAITLYFQKHPNSSLEQDIRLIKEDYNNSRNKNSNQEYIDHLCLRLEEMIGQLQERVKTSSPPPKSSSIFDKLRDWLPSTSKSKATPAKMEQSLPQLDKLEDLDFDYETTPLDALSDHEETYADTAPPDMMKTDGSPPPSPSSSPFQQGKVMYAIPSTMPLSTASRCTIRIAPESIPSTDLAIGLSKAEKEVITNEAIKITPVMNVELIEAHEGNNFSITSRNNSEQPILPFGYTEWAFDITPKRPGHYALLLRVSAKVKIPQFGERPYDVAVLDKAIQVTSHENVSTNLVFENQPIPDPIWDKTDQRAVEHALANGRIDVAIERLINFVQDKDREFQLMLLQLQGRWNDNTNQLNNRLIRPEDWDLVNNQVRYAITQLLVKIEAAYPKEGKGIEIDWRKEKIAIT